MFFLNTLHPSHSKKKTPFSSYNLSLDVFGAPRNFQVNNQVALSMWWGLKTKLFKQNFFFCFSWLETRTEVKKGIECELLVEKKFYQVFFFFIACHSLEDVLLCSSERLVKGNLIVTQSMINDNRCNSVVLLNYYAY